jgi:hypothetical protein
VLLSLVRVHVAPPSDDRYRPLGDLARGFVLSGFAFGSVSASTIVYITLGFDNEIAMLMRPFIVSGNPPPLISVHVLPASVDFHSAEPGPPELRK